MQVSTRDHAASDQALENGTPREESAARIGPHRLLLAEDDGAFRYLLASELRKDGYEVVAVSNGVGLIDILGDSLSRDGSLARFDLVLSDLRMPGWPGLEALAKFGHSPGMPPFILFTAFGDEKIHKRALDIGALTLLDKPFDLDYLRELVAQVFC
jgi:CheY-like chemotaxis protein